MAAGGPKVCTIDKIAKPKFGASHYFYLPDDSSIKDTVVPFDKISPHITEPSTTIDENMEHRRKLIEGFPYRKYENIFEKQKSS